MRRLQKFLLPTCLAAHLLLLPTPADAADTYTLRWSWQMPHVEVRQPAEFSIAVGDVVVTEEDVSSADRVMGLVGVLTVTAEVSITGPTPVVHPTTCATGGGIVLTLPDVAGATYVEASFVRQGSLEVLAGPHRTETGSGGPVTFRLCGPAAVGRPVADEPVPDGQDEPAVRHGPSPQDETAERPGATPCRVPPRADEAEGRGAPCPPSQDDHAARAGRQPS